MDSIASDSTRLNRVGLSHLLDARCFPKATYSLFGSHGVDAVVLDNRGGQWVVFDAQRGSEENLSRFEDEAFACDELLRRLDLAVPSRMRWSWYLREQGFELEFEETATGVTGIRPASLRLIGGPGAVAPAYGLGASQEDAAGSAAERWRLEQLGTISEAERLLSEAVVIWTGHGLYERPHRDDRVLGEPYGEKMAADLLPRVRALEEESPDRAHEVGTWPCRSRWEKTAIDFIAQGCEQLGVEVFRAPTLDEVRERCTEFFALMPVP